MENKKWDYCYRRSHKGKPPRGRSLQSSSNQYGVWRPTVASWEKRFCKEIGCVEWEALVEAKKYIHFVYTEIMKWDDSAAQEAFVNAKRRYWARINGVPCDLPLPDPDLYIDKDIKWDEDDEDLELLLDDQKDTLSDCDKGNVMFGDSFVGDQPYCGGVGWGDEFKADHSPAAVFEGGVKQGSEEAEDGLHYKSYGGLPIFHEKVYWGEKKFGSGREAGGTSGEVGASNARAESVSGRGRGRVSARKGQTKRN